MSKGPLTWLHLWPLEAVPCWLLCPFSRTQTVLIFWNTFLLSSITVWANFCSLAPALESAVSRGLCLDPRPGLCSHSLIREHQPSAPPPGVPSVYPCGPCKARPSPCRPSFLLCLFASSSCLSSAVCFLVCVWWLQSLPQPVRSTSPHLPCQGSHSWPCMMQVHSLGYWGPPLPDGFFYIWWLLTDSELGTTTIVPNSSSVFPGSPTLPSALSHLTPGHHQTGLWAF